MKYRRCVAVICFGLTLLPAFGDARGGGLHCTAATPVTSRLDAIPGALLSTATPRFVPREEYAAAGQRRMISQNSGALSQTSILSS